MSEVEKDQQMSERMARLGVRESDIVESFVRSGGHGGQNVNKTSTCVMLQHLPTGLQVKCQETRQQGQNRVRAKKLLLDKIESVREQKRTAERDRLEKIRRQKRPRPHGVKQRILDQKSKNSAKKKSRRTGFED